MRQAYIELSPELFIEFCKASGHGSGLARRFVVKKNPLPDDVNVVRIEASEWRNLRLVLESESFADVPDGSSLPRLPDTLYEAIYEAPVEIGGEQ